MTSEEKAEQFIVKVLCAAVASGKSPEAAIAYAERIGELLEAEASEPALTKQPAAPIPAKTPKSKPAAGFVAAMGRMFGG